MHAIAWAESKKNPKAVNDKTGATGIMQWMPRSASKPGFGLTPFEAGLDPKLDIEKSGQYMKALLTKFGSIPAALAAYNWGPGNVATYGHQKAPAETRAYINNILEMLRTNTAEEMNVRELRGAAAPASEDPVMAALANVPEGDDDDEDAVSPELIAYLEELLQESGGLS